MPGTDAYLPGQVRRWRTLRAQHHGQAQFFGRDGEFRLMAAAFLSPARHGEIEEGRSKHAPQERNGEVYLARVDLRQGLVAEAPVFQSGGDLSLHWFSAICGCGRPSARKSRPYATLASPWCFSVRRA